MRHSSVPQPAKTATHAPLPLDSGSRRNDVFSWGLGALVILLVALPLPARADVAAQTAAALKNLTEKRIELQAQRKQAEAELHTASAALSQKIAGAQLQGRDPLSAWVLQGGTLQNAWQADVLRRATTAPIAQRARIAREKQRYLDALDQNLQHTTHELEAVQKQLATSLEGDQDADKTLRVLLSALSKTGMDAPSGTEPSVFLMPASGEIRLHPSENRISITPLTPEIRTPASATVLYIGQLKGLDTVIVLSTAFGRFVFLGPLTPTVTTGDKIAGGTRIAATEPMTNVQIQADGTSFPQLMDFRPN